MTTATENTEKKRSMWQRTSPLWAPIAAFLGGMIAWFLVTHVVAWNDNRFAVFLTALTGFFGQPQWGVRIFSFLFIVFITSALAGQYIKEYWMSGAMNKITVVLVVLAALYGAITADPYLASQFDSAGSAILAAGSSSGSVTSGSFFDPVEVTLPATPAPAAPAGSIVPAPAFPAPATAAPASPATSRVVTGTAFLDMDGDGAMSAGDSRVGSYPVLITDSTGMTVTVTTDLSGLYSSTVTGAYTPTDPGGYGVSFDYSP